MRLVDTSAWIEWLTDPPTGEMLKPKIPDRDDWLVPTIVQLELAKWLTREVGEDEAERVIAFTQLCRVASLDTNIALAAAGLSAVHKLASADAIIYATALQYGADLLTCDGHFDNLPNVVLVPKIRA